MPRRKKKPIEEKHPIELTDDEAMEWMFGREARDKLKKVARKARKTDTYGKNRPIGELYGARYRASKA